MKDKLEQIREQWVHLLKLDEWDIALTFSKQEALDGKNARLDFSRINGQAYIQLAESDEKIKTILPFGYDEEKALVQQLLTLRLETVHHEDATSEIYFRRAVRILAGLLVMLKHKADLYDNMLQKIGGEEEPKPEEKKRSAEETADDHRLTEIL